MKKGFTLVELMIVVAIIAILAAIAIPNLLQSRVQANEASAIAACKTYFSAQVLFHRSGFAANAGSGKAGVANIAVQPQYSGMYAAPYIALYATNDGGGSPISLISSSFAAGSMQDNPNPLINSAPNTANPIEYNQNITLVPAIDLPAFSPYQGYIFADDTTRGNTFLEWCSGFGFFATPFSWSSTGYNTFWVGNTGVVYARNLRQTQSNYDDFMRDARTANKSVEGMIAEGSNLWRMTK